MQSELKRSPTSFRRALKGRILVFAGTDGRPATKDQNDLVAFLADNSAWSVRWKDNVRGNPYRLGDEVSVQPGDMLMTFVEEEETELLRLRILFPRASVHTAGQEIRMVNLIDKKQVSFDPNTVLFIPAEGDRIGRGVTDEVVGLSEPTLFGVMTFVSDGNGHWSNSIGLGGNLFVAPPP